MFREVAQMFASDAPKLVAELRRAARSGDCIGLATAAHSLRGALGYVGARAPGRLALKLEELGKAGNLAEARQEFEALAEQMARLDESLSLFVAARETAG